LVGAAALAFEELLRGKFAGEVVEVFDGGLVALGRRGGEPEIGFGQVVGGTQTVQVADGQIQLGFDMAFAARLCGTT